jgi:hypothetical protein
MSHNDVTSHHDVSKGLGPNQKSGGIRPNSGDAPRPGPRPFDSPKDHPYNARPVSAPAEPGDWDSRVPEVPSRPTRERVPPNNDDRRTPFLGVDAITSDNHYSHVAEPVPSKL